MSSEIIRLCTYHIAGCTRCTVRLLSSLFIAWRESLCILRFSLRKHNVHSDLFDHVDAVVLYVWANVYTT